MSKKSFSVSDSMYIGEFIEYMTSIYSNPKAEIKRLTPFMLWGSPGVGKSDAMRQIAERVGKARGKKTTVTDVRLLLFNPVDLRGIPVANEDRTMATWLKPSIFALDPSPEVINFLVLDEISAAPPSVQASAYQLTLDRCVGEHKIPDNTVIICAGNKVTDKSVAYKMPKALANRLCHIDVTCNLEDWKPYAINVGVAKEVLGYLSQNPSKLFSFDPSSEDTAFATPRSWMKVSDIINITGSISQSMPVIKGLIGNAFAYDFKVFTEVYDKIPNIELILEGKCKDVPERPDVTFALLSSLLFKAMDLVVSSNDVSAKEEVRKDNTRRMKNLFKYVNKISSDFSTMFYKDCLTSSNKQHFVTALADEDEFDKVVALFNKVESLERKYSK